MKKCIVFVVFLWFLSKAVYAQVFSCSVPSDLAGNAKIEWIENKILETRKSFEGKQQECRNIVPYSKKAERECWDKADEIQQCVDYLMAARNFEFANLESKDKKAASFHSEEFYAEYEQQASRWAEKKIKQRLGDLGFQAGKMIELSPGNWQVGILRWHPDKVLAKYKYAVSIKENKKKYGPVTLIVGMEDSGTVIIDGESLKATPIVLDFEKLAGDFSVK